MQARDHPGDRAGAVAAVKLHIQHQIPGIAARSGGSGNAEDKRVDRLSGKGPRLQGRNADRSVARLMEQNGKTIHVTPEQRLNRFGRDIAFGKSGSAGGHNDLDSGVIDPLLGLCADRHNIVGDNGAGHKLMAGSGQSLDQQPARCVGFFRARI